MWLRNLILSLLLVSLGSFATAAERGSTWQGWAMDYLKRAEALRPSGENLSPLARDVLETVAAPADETSRGNFWPKVREAAQKTKASCGKAPDTAALPVFLEQAV